jgi:replicative DNA helicase
MEAVTAKVPALYVALSERGDQIAERALVQRTSIQNVALRRGLLLRSEMEQLVKAASVVATAPFHIEDGRDMTAVAIRDLVTEWRAQVDAPVAMVVLDYVQLLNGEPNARSNTRDEELAAAVRTLQSAAKESRVVFVLVSQLNRRWAQREDPRPHLVDLRESGSLEGVATAVLFTHPPVAQDLHFEVILAKHRRCAAPQTDEFVFDGANGSFRPFMPAD